RGGVYQRGRGFGHVIEVADRARGFAPHVHLFVAERPGQRLERARQAQVPQGTGAFPSHVRVRIVEQQPLDRWYRGPLVQVGQRSSGPLVSCRSPTPAAYAALSRILGDAFSSKLPSTLADTALCPSNFAATRRTHWLSLPSVATRSDTARGSVMRPARESFAPWTLGASSKRPKRPGSSPIQKLPSWSPIKSQITGS